ncbi:MAG: hypothetical protein ACI4KH_04545, partial [Oscillospiraceae bacterium]
MSLKSQKQGEKTALSPYFYIAAIVAAVLLFSFTLIWVKNVRGASENMVNTLAEFYLGEIAERNSNEIASRVAIRTEQIKKAVEELDYESLKDKESVNEYIALVQKLNGLDIFALVDENGMVYTADSTFSGISRFGFLSEEITDTTVYSIKSYGTKTMLAVAIPVKHREYYGVHIVSCFTAIDVNSIISADQLQNEENRTYSRLFDRNGNNLLSISGEYPDGRNLFDIYEETAEFAPGYSLEKLKDDWQNGAEGYCVYSTETSDNTYLYYKPIQGTDWIITSLMRESQINEVVESGSQEMMKYSALMLVVVTASLLAFFIYALISARNIRKSRSDREQLKIVGALSNDYSDIFLLDPMNDKASTMKEHGKMHPSWSSDFRSYSKTWGSYVDSYVVREDRERVLNISKPENILDIMKKNEEFSFDFRVVYENEIHNIQAKSVRLFGETERLIVGFRNIDEQIRAEEERRKT